MSTVITDNGEETTLLKKGEVTDNGEETTLLKKGEVKPDSANWRLYARVLLVYILYTLVYSVAYSLESQFAYAKAQEKYGINKTSINATDRSLCYENTSSKEYILEQKVESEASDWILYFSLAAGVPSVLSIVLIGSLSDFVGRRAMLLVPCFGTLVRLGVFLAVLHFNLNIGFYLIGKFVEGFTGYIFCMIMVCAAYSADLMPPGKNVTTALAMLDGVAGLVFALGGLGAGYFTQATGFFYPILTCFGLLVVCILVIFLLLPSPSANEKRIFKNPFTHLKRVFSFYHRDEPPRKRVQYWLCILVMFFYCQTDNGRGGVETLNQINSPFCWLPAKIGWWSFGLYMSQRAGLFSIPVLQFSISAVTIGILATVTGLASYLVEGFANTDWLLYIVPVVGIWSNTMYAIIHSVMSEMAGPDEQGAVLASAAFVETVTNMSSTVLLNGVYSATLELYKRAVFFLMSACNGIVLALLIALWCIKRSVRGQAPTSAAVN